MRALVAAMRPHQWVKNGFLFAPLVFSKNLFDIELLLRSLLGFVCFCMAASAVYLGNDLFDLEADRAHPVKRDRPIASGRLPASLARLAAGALAGLAFGVGFLVLGFPFAAVVLSYLLMNAAYTVQLKHVAFLDVALISFGFVLRVVAGARAIAVPISMWLFVCTFALSLYLALGKREHELLVAQRAGASGAAARLALKGYSLTGIDRVLVAAGAVALGSYFLYTVAPETHEKFGTWDLAFTLPFPAYGIWRFRQLARRATRSSSPTEALVTDPPFVANLAVWLVATVLILYRAG